VQNDARRLLASRGVCVSLCGRCPLAYAGADRSRLPSTGWRPPGPPRRPAKHAAAGGQAQRQKTPPESVHRNKFANVGTACTHQIEFAPEEQVVCFSGRVCARAPRAAASVFTSASAWREGSNARFATLLRRCALTESNLRTCSPPGSATCPAPPWRPPRPRRANPPTRSRGRGPSAAAAARARSGRGGSRS